MYCVLCIWKIHYLTTVRGKYTIWRGAAFQIHYFKYTIWLQFAAINAGEREKRHHGAAFLFPPPLFLGNFVRNFWFFFPIPTTQVAEYYSQVHAALHFPNLPCLTAIAADAETVLFFPLEVCSLEYSPLAPPLTQLGVERGLGGEGGGGGGLDTGGWDMEDS